MPMLVAFLLTLEPAHLLTHKHSNEAAVLYNLQDRFASNLIHVSRTLQRGSCVMFAVIVGNAVAVVCCRLTLRECGMVEWY